MSRTFSAFPTDKWHPGLSHVPEFEDQFNVSAVPTDIDHISPTFGVGEAALNNLVCVVAGAGVGAGAIAGVVGAVVTGAAAGAGGGSSMLSPACLPNNYLVSRLATIYSKSVEAVTVTQTASVGTFKFLAHESPELARAIDSLKLLARRMFPGSSTSSTLYTDPEEGWQKFVLEVDLARSDKENSFELEERFIDAVCETGEYDSALRKIILRVR